jgi:type I restriction enzyme S subunit
MKNGWQSKRLGALCDIELGKTPSRAEKSYWDEERKTGNVWLSIADLLNGEDDVVSDSKEYISDKGASICKTVRKGTLLLSFKLTLGRLAFAGRNLYTNEAIAALSIFDESEISKEFLYYFLHSFDWDKATEGDVKIKGRTLNKAKLKEIPVHYPILKEQNRIVDILDEAFSGITTAKANTQSNLQNARTIFYSYLQKVFACRPNMISVGDLASDVTDGDHMPPPKANEGVPFITISNIIKRTREIDFSDTFTVPESYFAKLKYNKKPRAGDVLYTVTGATLGIPVLVKDQRDFCFQRHIGLIRPSPETDSSWLAYALLSPQVFKQATTGSTGAAQKTVSLSVLRGLTVPRMNPTEQRQVASQLDELSTETQELETIYERKLAAFEELKRSLLRQAFMGNL